jgi:hypothetical protein
MFNDNDTDYVIITPTADLLVVSKDDLIHREITFQQLHERCHILGNHWWCTNLGTFYKSFLSSCLGRLFADKAIDNNFKLCPTQPFLQSWKVIAENETTIIIFSRKRRGLDVLCPQGKRERTSIIGIDFIRIQPGCMISDEEFVTRRSNTQTMDEQRILIVPWTNETITSWTAIWNEDKRREANLEKDLKEMKMLSEETIKEEIDEEPIPWSETMPPYVWGLIATTAVLAITLVSLLVFLLWRFKQARPQN